MYEADIHHIGAADDLIVNLVFYQSEVISYIKSNFIMKCLTYMYIYKHNQLF